MMMTIISLGLHSTQNLIFHLSQELKLERDLELGRRAGHRHRVLEQNCSGSVFFKSVLIEEPFIQVGRDANALSIKSANNDAVLKWCPSLPVLSPKPTVGHQGQPYRTPTDSLKIADFVQPSFTHEKN